jgi:predicted TIM-barrel enzyme
VSPEAPIVRWDEKRKGVFVVSVTYLDEEREVWKEFTKTGADKIVHFLGVRTSAAIAAWEESQNDLR